MNSKKTFLMMVVLFAVGFSACESAFGEWWEWWKLIADDTAAGDRYGYSVSIYGTKAIVGAIYDEDRGDASGSAYIFERSSSNSSDWTQVAKLVPSDIGPGDQFGTSVSIQGNRAIVGSWSLDGQTGGVAYIFEDNGSGWEQVARLRPSSVGQIDQFGTSVAINQKMAVVGAPANSDLGLSGGAIYIFWNDGSGWAWKATLRGYAGDLLGTSVGITWMGGSMPEMGNYDVVAGSPGYNFQSGCVEVFHYEFMVGGWFSDTITPSDGAVGDRFGYSVSTPWASSPKVIIVGAPRDDDAENGADSGSAYIFTKTSSGWEEEKLKADDGYEGDEFGYSVGFSQAYGGARVIVGAHRDDDNGLSSGSAYIFDRSGSEWTQTEKLTPRDGASSDAFGRSVSLVGNTALIGALFDDNYGPSSGSAYMFSSSGPLVIRVDADATGANNGRSWADAYNYLQDALAVGVSGDEIWVAEGTYRPDRGGGQKSGDRAATFQLVNGVAIKGGYAGFGEPNPNDRDIDAYRTILSGIIGRIVWPPIRINSLHVVTSSGTGAGTILDGFTITGGNANGSGRDARGGGMIIESNGKPTITNCTFLRNSAGYGGGLNNEDYCIPMLANCSFRDNTANSLGGGMFNKKGSDAKVTNCTFGGNSAGGSGGGMYNSSNSPTVTNCILWGNSAGTSGDEIFNKSSTPTISSSDIRGSGGSGRGWNSALGTDGGGNIDANPKFVSASNLRLQGSSRCIDLGDDSAVTEATDLDGRTRIVDGDCDRTATVDMGAYEFSWAYMGDFDRDCDLDFRDFAILGLAWWTEAGETGWNPDCDISVPADKYIDWLDLNVFSDNWPAGL